LKLIYAILLSIVSSFLCANETQIANTHIYHYEILSNADDVGDITVKVAGQADGSYVIAESRLLKTAGVWSDINKRSTQIETFSPEGDLLKADVKTLKGKKAYWRRAELSGDELWASYAQVQNLTEKEEEEFVGATLAFASNIVPGLGDVLGVAQLLFSDNETQPDNLRFSTSAYDTSFSNLPFYWSSKQNNLPTQLNLFDSVKLAVKTYQIEYLGQKTFQSGSEEEVVITSHYKLQASKDQSLEVWLASNEQNSPYFYQIVGADDGGPFHIIFKKHEGV
jgi:hypothetical protein